MPPLPDLPRPLRNGLLEFRVRWRMRHGLGRMGGHADLVPVTLASALGASRSSSEIIRLARRCMITRAQIVMDHKDLEGGGRCHEVRNREPLLELKRRGIGAVVCSLHLGPYFYVPLELAAMGIDQVVFAADTVRDRLSAPWEKVIRNLPGRVETLPARGTRSLMRALRALRDGWSTVIYMDGQTGVGGPGAGRRHSVDVELASLPVRLRIGPAYLSQRANVPIVLAAARRGRNGRREVEFSEPIPPPEGDGHEGRAERVLGMVGWFDERIRRDLDQWTAWFSPLLTWSRSGDAPTATREDLERTRARVEGLIAQGRSGRARLHADPARVAPLEFPGCRALVHGPTRRILEASPLSRDLLTAALRGVPMRRLPRLFPVERSELVLEVTRMVLADLATIDEGRGA